LLPRLGPTGPRPPRSHMQDQSATEPTETYRGGLTSNQANLPTDPNSAKGARRRTGGAGTASSQRSGPCFGCLSSAVLTHPKNASRRPTAWLGISDTNFDVQRENSSL
jgi:hypothetical protein